MRVPPIIFTVLALAASGGCSTFDGSYRFWPRPMEVPIELPGEVDQTPVRMLASVVGLRRADRRQGTPAAIEVRVRLDNTGNEPATLRPGSLSLIAGNLVEFPTPRVEPPGTMTVQAGSSATLTAWFPFPGNDYPGPFDLGGLTLRCTVTVDDHLAHVSASFRRVRRVDSSYPPEYWGPPRWGSPSWGRWNWG